MKIDPKIIATIEEYALSLEQDINQKEKEAALLLQQVDALNDEVGTMRLRLNTATHFISSNK